MPISPLSLQQISSFLERKKRSAQFFQYSQLPDDPVELSSLFLRPPPSFVFYTSNGDEVGHWTAMRRGINKQIYWFSSYGFLPDGELMVSADMRGVPGQQQLKISRALEYLRREKGYQINYSRAALQSVGDGSVTCGIWVLMFLTAKLDPSKDEPQDSHKFEEFEEKLSLLYNPQKYAEAIYNKEIGDK